LKIDFLVFAGILALTGLSELQEYCGRSFGLFPNSTKLWFSPDHRKTAERIGNCFL